MGGRREDGDERLARLERMLNEAREARRRRLVKRGIELWNRTEKARKASIPSRSRPVESLPR